MRDHMDCYGLDTALQFLNERATEFKTLSNNHPLLSQFTRRLTALVQRGAPDPKMERLASIVLEHCTQQVGRVQWNLCRG